MRWEIRFFSSFWEYLSWMDVQLNISLMLQSKHCTIIKQQKILTLPDIPFHWFWVEPFWDFTLKSGEFSFNNPEGSKSYLVKGTEIEGSYIFSGENINWELILEECQDASKGDLHKYKISLILDGESTYEGCADPEK